MDKPSQSKEFLSFSLGGETFSVSASDVIEVVKGGMVTNIPRMPAYLPGAINIRGSIIAVVDLAMFFGITGAETDAGWFIIMETSVRHEPMLVGIRADAVHDVVRLDALVVDPSPDIGIAIDQEFVMGVAEQDQGYLILLDIDAVINTLHKNVCLDKKSVY